MRAEGGGRKAEGFALKCCDRIPAQRNRIAMTLFELLLVLVLLVIIGSLAAPLFEGSFSSIRLRRGTDQILAVWSQTRTHAIEAGTIFEFRFQPAGDKYRVDPWSGGLEIAMREPREKVELAENSTDVADLANWNLEESLPEKIVFLSAESVSEDKFGERTVKQLDQDSETKWSEPILFFPDGTTSDASLLLKSEKDLYRRATLRALTGVARASELLSREEVERPESR